MKKLLLGILALMLFVIAACTSLGGTAQNTCNNDNYCSLNEQLVGNCADCNPDFSVSNEIYVAQSADSNNAYAEICVLNKNGQYDGDVQLTWGFKGTYFGHEEPVVEKVNFVSDYVRGYFNLGVRNKKLIFDSHYDAGDNEEMSCFSHAYKNLSAKVTALTFEINQDKAVTELNYDNNYVETPINITAPPESYPEFLIEENIGDNRYLRSKHIVENESINGTFYAMDIYEAGYESVIDKSLIHDVSVVGFENSALAKTAFDDIILTGEDFINMSLENLSNGELVRFNTKSRTNPDGSINYFSKYLWLSGKEILYLRIMSDSALSKNKSLADTVAIAYSNRYNSDLSVVAPPVCVTCAEPTEGCFYKGTTCDSCGTLVCNDPTINDSNISNPHGRIAN